MSQKIKITEKLNGVQLTELAAGLKSGDFEYSGESVTVGETAQKEALKFRLGLLASAKHVDQVQIKKGETYCDGLRRAGLVAEQQGDKVYYAAVYGTPLCGLWVSSLEEAEEKITAWNDTLRRITPEMAENHFGYTLDREYSSMALSYKN